MADSSNDNALRQAILGIVQLSSGVYDSQAVLNGITSLVNGLFPTDGPERLLSLLDADGCATLWENLRGEPLVRDFLVDVLKNSQSNGLKRKTIKRIADLSEDNVSREWCRDREEDMLNSLDNFHSPEEMEWLLEIAIDHGTEEFMTRILPQVASKKLAPSYWLHFIQHMLDHGHPEASLDELVLHCLETTIEQFSLLPRDPKIDSTSLADDIIKLMALCIQTKHATLCAEIFATMRAMARAPLHKQVLEAFAELVPTLIKIIKTTTTPNPIRVFREALFDICGIMNSTTACTMGLLSDSRHRDAVVSAVETLGSLEALLSSNVKDHSSPTRIALARALGEHRKSFPDADYDKVLAMLLRAKLQIVDQAFESSFEKTFRPFQDHVVQWVKRCIQLEARAACANLFASLRSHSSSDSYLMGLLAPIIPLVAELFQAESCSGALRNIFESFATEVLKSFSVQLEEYKTRKQTFESFECSEEGTCCSGCNKVRGLFLYNWTSVSFSEIAKDRAHVESRLVSSSAQPLLKWWTSRSSNRREPYTLKIEKKLLKHPGALWALDSLIANGKAYLSSLGDVRRVLGGHYDEIYSGIHGHNPPAADLDSDLPAASSSTAKRPAEEEASGSDPKRARTEDEN